MKVLFLKNVLFEYRVPFFNALQRAGFDVTVLHSQDCSKTELQFKQLVVPTRQFVKFKFQSLPSNILDYDFIIAMFDLHWPINAILAILPMKPRVIFWGHGLGKNKLGNKLRVFLANRSYAMICYTQSCLEQMISAGLKRSKAFIANNTIEVANHEGKLSQGNSFLYVGRLQTRKKIDWLIKAFAIAKQKGNWDHVYVDIVGDGDIKSDLIILAESLNVSDWVRFHGSITDNTRLKSIFHRAIAYVSPGPLGLGTHHALAFGVPVVSNRNHGHGPEIEVLTENNSILYSANTEQDNVKSLSHILSHLVDNKERAMALSRQGYQDYLQNCSMENMVNGFVNVLRSKNLKNN